MDKQIKASDEITPIDVRIVYYHDIPHILHIVRRIGVRIGSKFDGSPYRITYMITDCNRIDPCSSWASETALPTSDNSGWKLCTCCGTREDFEKVLAEYCERERPDREMRYHQFEKGKEREKIEHQRAYKNRMKKLSDLANALNAAGFTTVIEDESEQARLSRMGVTFCITLED